MEIIEYEEIQVIKQSEKSTVLLVREADGEQVFVQKILKGRHQIYSELRNYSHPYLPKLYEVTLSDHTTTIIEEYIDGQSLGSAQLSEKQIVHAVKELCSVLEFLHELDIIHRDIKPSNIILAKDGHIRLIDFDAARMGKDALEQEQDTRLLGTRGYAPPEQYGFAQTDARADIYSLGITLKQLFGTKAKKHPYKKIVKKCTDLNPNKRYQSVTQVKKALTFSFLYHWYLPVALASACILCVAIFNPPQQVKEDPLSPHPSQIQSQTEPLTPQSNEFLLFEAQKSEYIIISELDIEQGKSATMQVDMTDNGNLVEFSIAYNDHYQLAGTTAKSTGGVDTGLWYNHMQELLHGIPYNGQFSDQDCIIQITCADADSDGIKEIFVTRGDGKQAVATFVWQFIPGDDSNPDSLKPVGAMWGTAAMRLIEQGQIRTTAHNLLPALIYYYDNGYLGELNGIYLTTYKEFQENEHANKNNSERTDMEEFDPLKFFPNREWIFESCNVKWGIPPT